MKFTHKYLCKEDTYPYTVSFIITTDSGERYGHYEEYYSKEDKYRLLRSLVLTKQKIVDDLVQINTGVIDGITG